jgi:ABC-type phosphate/phosphonate transport system substrate-binding protein
MRAGHVHFAWLTPSPLVLAERLFGVRVLLTQVRRGQPTYYSALVVREDSRFHSSKTCAAAPSRGSTPPPPAAT